MVDFDQVVNRKGTGCVKWDTLEKQYGRDDIIPMWVADMDFAVAEEISDTLKKRANHPIYGYSARSDIEKKLFAQHFQKQCHHECNARNVILSTGVVYSMNACIQRLTKKGDKIMIHSPAYPPFRRIIEENGRVIVDTPMKIVNGRYEFDFENMEQQGEGCKIFMLCNPQNPTGRVFEKEELERLAAFVEKHQMYVIVDEIHADFIYGNKEFIPFMEWNDYTRNHTITCVSCTKSFNLAGLNVSAIFIENEELYQKINNYTALNGLQSINLFGLCALRAAYQKSEYWLEELVRYLEKNRDEAYEFIKNYLPKAKVCLPESTYLMWIDLRAYQLTHTQAQLVTKAGVLLNDGKTFGDDYEGFVRFNFACPRSQMMAALERMKEYLKEQ